MSVQTQSQLGGSPPARCGETEQVYQALAPSGEVSDHSIRRRSPEESNGNTARPKPDSGAITSPSVQRGALPRLANNTRPPASSTKTGSAASEKRSRMTCRGESTGMSEEPFFITATRTDRSFTCGSGACNGGERQREGRRP